MDDNRKAVRLTGMKIMSVKVCLQLQGSCNEGDALFQSAAFIGVPNRSPSPDDCRCYFLPHAGVRILSISSYVPTVKPLTTTDAQPNIHRTVIVQYPMCYNAQ